jgi:hypothetical protein
VTTPADDAPVRVQTRFERFPASIRGAFVLAGADGDPHAVHIVSAGLLRIGEGSTKPVPLEDRQLNVAPSRDLFVPFEVAVTDLEPGWYRLVSSVRVDGGRVWDFEGRPFTIPWPRSDVRRGVLSVERRTSAGGREYEIDRVELGSDAAVVVWRGPEESAGREPGGQAVLIADGVPLAEVPAIPGSKLSEPRVAGERRSVSYPVPRTTGRLEIVIRPASGKASKPVPVAIV